MRTEWETQISTENVGPASISCRSRICSQNVMGIASKAEPDINRGLAKLARHTKGNLMIDFIVHKDYEKSIKEMSNEEVGELVKALIAHTENDEPVLSSPVVRAVFPIMADHIDRDIEYRQRASAYGKKGGAPFGNTNAKTRVNKGGTRVTQGLVKAKQTPKPIPIPKPINNKRPYGECQNVLLSDDEYKKIQDQGLTNLIDELSFYIAGSGKQYKSHYAVIRQWANRREKEKNAVIIKPNQFIQGVGRREINFSDLEKKLVKN